MYLIEFESNLFETVLKLQPSDTRKVYVTDSFLRDVNTWKHYAGKDIGARLDEFIRFKLQNGTRPFGVKDQPLTGFKGIWKYHLDHGKVILIYSAADTHVELYSIDDHNSVEGGSTSARLHPKLGAITANSLFEWKWQTEKKPSIRFSTAQFEDMMGWIYGLLDQPSDKEMLRQYAAEQSGPFIEFLTGWVSEIHPNASPEEALNAFLTQWEKKYHQSLTRTISLALGI